MKQRQGNKGFSILEAMVAAGVLGISLVGLVNMQKHAVHEMHAARQMQVGLEIGRQVMDNLMAKDLTLNCDGRDVLSDPMGCRKTMGLNTDGTGGQMTDPKRLGCSVWVNDQAIVDEQGDLVPAPGCAPGMQSCPRSHRVDIALTQDPAGANLRAGSILVDVWVCWRMGPSASDAIQETQLTRVIVPGL